MTPTGPITDPLAARANFMTGLALLPDGCRRFLESYREAFLLAPGSGHNHQAWSPGGLADHLDECFAIAAVSYKALAALRPLPFTLADALLVLFLHDVEKTFARLPADTQLAGAYAPLAGSDPHGLQTRICADFAIALTAQQHNALAYIHGEGETYRKDLRVAGELAAFCHCCDYLSARLWHDQPRRSGRLPDLIS